MGFGFFFPFSFLFNKSSAIRGRQKQRDSNPVFKQVGGGASGCAHCDRLSMNAAVCYHHHHQRKWVTWRMLLLQLQSKRRCREGNAKQKREGEREMIAIEKLTAADRPLNSLFPKQQSVCLGVSKPVLSTVLFSSSAAAAPTLDTAVEQCTSSSIKSKCLHISPMIFAPCAPSRCSHSQFI